MSYECDVAMTFKKADKEELCRMIEEWDRYREPDDGKGKSAKEVYDISKKVEDEKYFTLHWHWVGWYKEDSGYKFFKNLRREQEIDCDYICVGEDPGDIEEEYGLNAGMIDVYFDQHIVIG